MVNTIGDTRGKRVLVLGTALIVSIVSILHVIVGAIRTPPGSVYLWTGHYYLDYFGYVQFVAQGMRGRWLVENPFTTEELGATFLIWEPYLLTGKVAGLFGLSPIAAYWASIIVFSFLLSILIFVIIRKLLSREPFYIQFSAFLLTLFAAPFVWIEKIAGGLQLLPYDFWYAQGTIFKRFESVPHHLLGRIVILGLMLFVAHQFGKLSTTPVKKIIWAALFAAAIVLFNLTFYPYTTIILLLAIFMTALVLLLASSRKRSKKNTIIPILIFLVVFSIPVVSGGLLIRMAAQSFPLIERLHAVDTAYSYFPPLSLLLLVMGPVALFTPLGIPRFFRRISPLRLLFVNFVVLGFAFSFSHISSYFETFNLRFLSPLNYILIGVLAILGMKTLAGLINQDVKKTIVSSTVFLLLLFSPGVASFFYMQIHDSNLNSSISYLPKGVFEGFSFLDKTPNSGIVLTAPNVFLGAVVPIFADKHMYIGRQAVTINYGYKNIAANMFYLGAMDESLAYEFVLKNNIGYVFLASIENYDPDNLKKYHFLDEIFRNDSVVIFKVVQ